MCKFIFVSGGVVSGLGKGITAASLGRLLIARGIKVSAQKLDPYLNVDPGTMSPLEHGEVFVSEDGAETDLDLGHYERFMDVNLNKYSNITSGKVYHHVISKERKGEFLGQTAQVIPHITNEIKRNIYLAAKQSECEVLICEVGGTVGDIESQPFLEAIRQIIQEKGKQDCLYIHVTLVPYLKMSKEFKSKPTQHSIKELQSYGIMSDILIARSEMPLPSSICRKISQFCNIEERCVINNYDVSSLYEVVPMLEEAYLADIVCEKLHLDPQIVDLKEWQELIEREKNVKETIKIAMVGKYTELHDAYLSVVESLHHAGTANECKVEIKWVDSEAITDEASLLVLKDCQGILIPGGFGYRGIEGKIKTAQYARTHHIPYFGICLGMQIACIEFARNVLNYTDATSSEFQTKSDHYIIDVMKDQKNVENKGGTMRLGAYPCHIQPNSRLEEIYQQSDIMERHRHRYEFNNAYRSLFEEAGMAIVGTYRDGENELVEAVELKEHPFYVAVQFHPEFKSRPNRPHPLFKAFIKAAKAMSQ